METLTIHTEDAEKMQTVQAVLKALDVQFEPKRSALPPHILKDFEIGLEQYKSEKTISLEEFRAKHL